MDILIPSFSGLGNSILLSPMIQTILKELPEAKITVLGDDKYSALSILSGISDIKTIDQKDANLKKVMDAFEVILLPRLTSNKAFYEQAMKLHKHKKIIGHFPFFKINETTSPIMRARSLKELLKPITWSPVVVGRHEIDLNLDLAQLLINRSILPSKDTKIGINPKEDDLKKFGLSSFSYICLQPSAANGNPTPKRWSIKNFEQLKNELSFKIPNLKIVLLGDPGDLEVAKAITPSANLVNLIGQTDLQELVSILGFARVSVCHDSGIGHICSALTVPSIVLWGPTDFSRTRPIGNNIQYAISRSHFSEMYGFRLSERESYINSPNGEAMEGISVDTIINMIESIL